MNRRRNRNVGSTLARTSRAWAGIAVLVLNFTVLFALANVVVMPFTAADPIPPGGPLEMEPGELAALYPDLSHAEVVELLEETWARPYRYEPFTQFREPAYRGRFVNVHEAGFRVGPGKQDWPPDSEDAVFVFGGSTLFGYGLPDDRTPVALLAEPLRGCGLGPTYNWGRSNYYSTQELILFHRLLAGGHRPAVAVFVDGLNDLVFLEDRPKFSDRLTALMAEKSAGTFRRWLTDLPLARWMKTKLPAAHPESRRLPEESIGAALDRWATNRNLIRALAQEHEITTVFAWQPLPHPSLDERQPFLTAMDLETPPLDAVLAGDRMFQERRERNQPGFGSEEVLDLRDVGRAGTGALFVDRVHYSERMAGAIASALAEAICETVVAGDAGP